MQRWRHIKRFSVTILNSFSGGTRSVAGRSKKGCTDTQAGGVGPSGSARSKELREGLSLKMQARSRAGPAVGPLRDQGKQLQEGAALRLQNKTKRVEC